MARPLSEQKRNAIVEAAIATVAQEGTAASTSLVARRAGVAHGSVFHYFETKADLLNAAYLRLKAELDDAVVDGLSTEADPVGQLKHMWMHWMRWGTANPERRRALARLGNSDILSPETRGQSKAMAQIGIAVVEQVSAGGAFRGQPFTFVASFLDAVANATMDFMIAEPDRADETCETAFQGVKRALT
jgi:AcrR family transcriptional regulator